MRLPVATIPLLVWLDYCVVRMSPWHLRVFCLLLLLLIGYVDYLTGIEATLSIFYLFPVACMAWYHKGWVCLVYVLLLPFLWTTANHLAGDSSGLAISLWNGLVRLTFFSSVCVLIKQLQAALEREHALSRSDSLTGLLNRRAFNEALRVELARCQRTKSPLGLAYLDLDHFKKLNDGHGHTEGDRALKEVARLLEGQLRVCDVVARLGGDEFALLIPDCTNHGAITIADRLVKSVRELSAKQKWPLTASIGFVVLENLSAEDSPEAVLTLCDNTMYQVKKVGRDGYRVITHPPKTTLTGEPLTRDLSYPILRKNSVELLSRVRQS